MKRLFSMLFIGIVFVVGCNEKENLDEIDTTGETENNISGTEGFDFTINGIISSEQYERSEKTYTVDSGKEVLSVIATWSPLEAEVIFGFINKETDEEFWQIPQKSGGWQGAIQTSDLKAGEYYIAAKTIDDEKSDANIVAHFNWK